MILAKQKMTIQKWGDCLGLRISKPLGELALFEPETPVLVQVTTEGMTIKRLSGFKKNFINPFSPYTAHADELVVPLTSELGEGDE